MDLRRPANDPETAATQREVLPLLRVVGQMALTYVVAEGPDGMYLIDQHAAHERVVYDRLIGRPGSAPASQPLLEPVLVELEPAMAAAAVEHLPHLLALSFEAEEFGDRSLVVRAIPSAARTTDVGAAVHAILEKAAGERRLATPFDRAAASVACHASVRAGAALSLDEMRRLVEDLERAASPRTCPHGRPTLVHVGRDMIERQFGRR
jgi:DNA mismatch repair protein MutL